MQAFKSKTILLFGGHRCTQLDIIISLKVREPLILKHLYYKGSLESFYWTFFYMATCVSYEANLYSHISNQALQYIKEILGVSLCPKIKFFLMKIRKHKNIL